MDLKEAVATLSEFEHRGFQTWIVSKTTRFHRGEQDEKEIFVLPDPEGSGAAELVLLPFEAIAIAQALHREVCEQMREAGDD